MTRRLLGPVAGVAAAFAIGGPTGIVLGFGTWWLVAKLLRSDPDRTERTAAERLAPAWPWTLDLLAAGMRAGAPFPQAAFAVADADDPEIGERLSRFAGAIHLGASATEALPELGRLPGASRLARQLDRSGDSGAAIAGGLEQLAASLRSELRNRAEERAGRAAVALVGPLCLCFLPAFVIAGIGPVVLGIVSDTLATGL
ncbi:Type II secretion system (T2SS), protein F [Glycomyces harbinensis]|uniref:Type II secretion system (T2SS), protein F n=2 Tax=Glycomyces harbinensis TaxID=58114 RepID=A0A1G7D706_9ACTN|nr:type II secretion system F family protein [Glycomyces harbinensis]SDE47297.1 Type II secretion system (T2SS), protein F [Glycomyces harbinensis]